jgi:DNA-binding transcriptional ArsR family regulator
MEVPMAVLTAPRAKPAGKPGIGELERKASEAAGLLKLLANENRLLILCRLAQTKEISVGELAEAVGLSQSALSQHLALLREQGLLGTRRDAQTVFYRLADPATIRLLGLLHDIYCPETGAKA